jgi:predicted site-specific integrase-resolvase
MDKLLTLQEAKNILNVSKSTLQRWDNSGKLIALRIEGGGIEDISNQILKIYLASLTTKKKKIIKKLQLQLMQGVQRLTKKHMVI